MSTVGAVGGSPTVAFSVDGDEEPDAGASLLAAARPPAPSSGRAAGA
ncbi:hypothetical protein [Wenjunlia vitaminophila]|nr:hypothetical protein [Wenjunlia vitaminophila]